MNIALLCDRCGSMVKTEISLVKGSEISENKIKEGCASVSVSLSSSDPNKNDPITVEYDILCEKCEKTCLNLLEKFKTKSSKESKNGDSGSKDKKSEKIDTDGVDSQP